MLLNNEAQRAIKQAATNIGDAADAIRKAANKIADAADSFNFTMASIENIIKDEAKLGGSIGNIRTITNNILKDDFAGHLSRAAKNVAESNLGRGM